MSTIVEALRWYAAEAESLAKHMKDGAHTQAVLASLTVLSLDAGKRARAALAALDALPVAEPDAIAFAVSVFDDVLSDIADWEDKTLSEACIEAKRRLCAAPAAQPDTKLCKRLIDEVVRRNGGSTPNWLIDMAPNTGDLNVQYR